MKDSPLQPTDDGRVRCSALLGGGEWLPISTAPKDSTIIDIWTPNDGRLTDYRREELSSTNVFYEPVYSGVCVVRDATHWMPIPEPPNEKAERRALRPFAPAD